MSAGRDALILVLAAEPEGTSPIGLDQEVRSIRLKLREAKYRDRIRVESYWATRPDDVMQALSELRPDIVHFSSHGTPASGLVLTSPTGHKAEVSGHAIAQLFKTMGKGVKAVVLNTCFSVEQAQEVARHVGLAIGMRGGISIEAAIKFSASFYRGLGYGKSFFDSFEEGKLGLLMHGIAEDDTPVLCTRPDCNPRQVFLVEPEVVDSPPLPATESPEPAPIPKGGGISINSVSSERDSFVIGEGSVSTGQSAD